MLDILQRMFGKEQNGSKDIAKERLRFVLVHDRVNTSPQFMEVLKDDMIKVISNYMEINEKEMEVSLSTTKSSVALVANIPINKMKRNVTTQE